MSKKRRQRAAKTPAAEEAAAAPAAQTAPGTPLWVHAQNFARACAPRLHTPAAPVWHLLPWLLLLAFVLRAVVALGGDFVIHPDEIMQYLEPAHGLVFGNKISYWEYYYGARSWLVPGILAGILFVCKAIGLGEPAYYIPAVKLALCALSLLIPFCLYVLGRRMFNENTARIALLLGVFWYELVGFAHKPMTEFLATSLFLALMVLALRPQRLTPAQAAVVGAFAVFVVAVRFQYAPLLAVLLLVPFLQGTHRTRLAMVAASAAAVVAVGLFEQLTWGTFMQSYWYNFRVNLLLNQVRGEEASVWRYLGWPTVASGGLFLLTLVWAAQRFRRYAFLLLLCLAIVLPHATQHHREYRFIFAMIPLWLLLFAHITASGWHVEVQRSFSGLLLMWRKHLAMGAAALVSALGIANAMPLQGWLYEAHSQEAGYVNFLRGQDEMFSIYRRLGADDTVRGVADVTRSYFNTGGYYYLHHKVPFYEVSYSPQLYADAKDYVSHIIAPPLMQTDQLARGADGRLLMVMKGGAVVGLPGFISDGGLNKLVYWTGDSQPKIVDGFTLSYESDRFTVWKAVEDTPVRQWRNHRVYPDAELMYDLVVKNSLGDDARTPVGNFGIEFE